MERSISRRGALVRFHHALRRGPVVSRHIDHESARHLESDCCLEQASVVLKFYPCGTS